MPIIWLNITSSLGTTTGGTYFPLMSNCTNTTASTMPLYSNIANTSMTTVMNHYYAQQTAVNQMTQAAAYNAAQDARERRRWYREREAEQQRQIEKFHAARAKAKRFLLEHLSPKQRDTFEKNKWFVVEGDKDHYRIEDRGSLVANIIVLRGGIPSHRLCGHCDISKYPLEDHLLAQKLMLEANEKEFLAKCNVHPLAA